MIQYLTSPNVQEPARGPVGEMTRRQEYCGSSPMLKRLLLTSSSQRLTSVTAETVCHASLYVDVASGVDVEKSPTDFLIVNARASPPSLSPDPTP